METLETLRDAYITATTYKREMKKQGKQNVASLNFSFETMSEIAARLFVMIEDNALLEDQINAAMELYAETLQDPNEQGYAYNYGMDLEESSKE